MEHTLPRTFTIGLLIAAALLVVMSEKASAQDYTSFYSTFLSPTYTIPSYSATPAYTPPVFHYTPAANYNYLTPTYAPYQAPPVYHRRSSSPFGPLPPTICGDPWVTSGLGLAGDDIPLRVCVL